MVFLLVILLLVLVNGYFSAAEISLVSVKKFRLQQEAERGNKRAGKVLSIIEDPDEYLSAIQVGITLVGIIEGLYGGEVLAALVEPLFRSWGLSPSFAHASALILSIGLITYFTIVIGELLPKSVALQFPQKTALVLASSFRIFTFVSYPFVKVLTASTRFIVRLLKVSGPENQKITEADLRSLLGLAYRQGTLEKTEWVLHENIFAFYDLKVEQIMTPAEKAVVLEESLPRDTVEKIIGESNHMYFPVRRKDNQFGLLSIRDFFMHRQKELGEIVMPACVVHGEQTAAELLQRFKQQAQGFGIVVNTHGSLTGIVTMHDVGEALVGKIP